MAGVLKRHALQGVWTVVRFNWHLHAAALSIAAASLSGSCFLSGISAILLIGVGACVLATVAVSLVATWWAYDASGLHQLDWLRAEISGAGSAAHIHAGFDELSERLAGIFPETSWQVWDFYDPEKHTEISIRRARKARPPVPGTVAVRTDCLPQPTDSLDRVLLFLAAHEIRDHEERVRFFREIRRVLRTEGRVIVTEHLRDAANIAVYSLGAWHFHTQREWLRTFEAAGFQVTEMFRNNRFITTFVLKSS
jgi:SAM-dependent methyltransferase